MSQEEHQYRDLLCGLLSELCTHQKSSVYPGFWPPVQSFLPPSFEVLEKRLRDRALDDEEAMKTRIEKAVKELGNHTWYDYIVINAELDKVVKKVESVIISERCRRSQMLPRVREMFGL